MLSDKTLVLWDVQEGAYVLTVLNRLEIFHVCPIPFRGGAARVGADTDVDALSTIS